MTEETYPCFKLFMMILLCPLFAGAGVAPIFFVSMLVELLTKPNVIGEMRSAENFMVLVVVPLILEVTLFVPFVFLALYLVLKRLRKIRFAVLATSVVGGGLLWSG
ncbi:hypothetical protein AB3464_03150 [Pseudomonas asplenii]|uniref:hypothetical protein n=1 Tax=Pseudomonas asplenii TaxID=53407 RepID=UPI0037C930C3